MIKSIIFSKNRPLQLDLTLNSIYCNFIGHSDISVIYYADKEYEDSYMILQTEHPDVCFINEKKASGELLDLVLKEIKGPCRHVVFFTDDIIFYRKYTVNNWAISLLDYNDFCCLSMRIGRNITHRGPDTLDIIPSQIHIENGHLIWNRMTIPPGGYWAYPLSVDGHIFRKDIIFNIIYSINQYTKLIDGSTQSPNRLEELMQMYFFSVGANMLAPEFSCVVNSPNNRVQNVIENKSGSFFPYQQENLNKLYRDGKRINLKSLDFSEINCPHKEIKLL